MIDSILPRTSLALAVTLTVAVFSSALAGCSDNAPTVGGADPALFVAVTQFVKQPSLDAVQRGLKDSLAEAGYVEGDTLRWEMINAKGNPVRAAQIATKYVRANPDVIVAIATPSAQAVAIATQNKNIPVIFSAVLNPVETKLVESLDKPGSTISGVSDLSPVSQDLMLIKEVLPEANTLGVIYTAGEADSAILVSRVKSQAPDQGFIEVKEVTVTDSSEVAEAARSLVGSVDAIYMVTDNTVTTALKSVIEVGQDNDLPVFADDTDAVEKRGDRKHWLSLLRPRSPNGRYGGQSAQREQTRRATC